MKYSNYNILAEDGEKFILYNSVTKASVKIDKKFKETYLRENGISLLSKDDFQVLKKNGFIIDDCKDELKELEYMFNTSFFRNDILNIAIVPSLKCNFSCPYCFEKVVQNKYENDNYFNVLKQYAQRNFHYHSVVQISLFGGEPLVREKDMLDFLKFAHKDSLKYDYRLKCNITTNGSLLNEENVKTMLECGLTSMQVTLDGGRKSHNTTRCFAGGQPSFDIIIDKIKMVLKLTKEYDDFNMIVRVNLNNNNCDDLSEILDQFTLQERERLNMMIRVIYNTAKYKQKNDNNVDNLKPYYDITSQKGAKVLKNHFYYQPCEACANSKFFYLMPDLTMWKCINDLSYDKAMFGKIEEDGTVSIDYDKMVNWYKAANCFADEKCLACKKLPDCFGGCVLNKLKNNKRICKTFDMACRPYCIKEN